MESMEEIYAKYAQTVYKFLSVYTHDADLAEELTQETFFRAVNGIKKYTKNSNISTWLCGIAKNVWYEYLRKKSKESELFENMAVLSINAEQAASPEKEYFTAWDSVELLRHLHTMKEPVKEVVLLRIMGNLSFRQIGEIMDESENWARVTFYRGKEKLIREVENDG